MTEFRAGMTSLRYNYKGFFYVHKSVRKNLLLNLFCDEKN